MLPPHDFVAVKRSRSFPIKYYHLSLLPMVTKLLCLCPIFVYLPQGRGLSFQICQPRISTMAAEGRRKARYLESSAVSTTWL